MPGYDDENMLQLSGIQHYVFCPRQWALIHVEKLWDDNRLTMEGSLLHTNVDNPFKRKTNGSSTITLRGLRIASGQLGLSGIADAVELYPHEHAPKDLPALIAGRLFTAMPVEYKRGHRKISDCDRIQVTAQAMILEEMLDISINKGAIFYWEEHHREYFDITPELRTYVNLMSQEMHGIMASNILPKVHKRSSCRSCSLANLCLPCISGKSVKQYLKRLLDEETA